MTDHVDQNSLTAVDADVDATIDRVLASETSHAGLTVFGGRATALQQADTVSEPFDDTDGEQYDREARAGLKRVAGLSTELEDVTEVEYRQLRLENVVLI